MIRELLQELTALSSQGGFAFYALVALAFAIAYALISISHALLLPGAPVLPQHQWQYMLSRRDIPPRMIHQLANALDPDKPDEHFHELDHQLFANLERRFPFAFVLIGTAPLIGLLGTVSGMLTTFSGMGSAHAVSVDAVSAGVSEALITTQAGLVIGVASLFICSIMRFRYEQLKSGFLRLEAAVKQQRG
ncbi:MotA/TolQ/ExbB proton channel family protein [Pontiella agarivorans]|uniref:MotA/TolQ/ExbB proton channel family protein n=1 Tax=Pontiella agarivorans TaxID=3038953 RepID=A0ABU5MVC5_9BACT|nr:MotA/TolQ/ExbB proton channel family protein [Pontiella agarivorans]MDZ8118152.1 MotA/TolQ/ExbB proton channel family protein [Pontiella agarivorans]